MSFEDNEKAEKQRKEKDGQTLVNVGLTGAAAEVVQLTKF